MTADGIDIILADPDGRDVGVLDNCTLETSYGVADESTNDFVLTCPEGTAIAAGSLVYVEDGEYGGIVDGADYDTGDHTVKYRGRSWHGVLAGKVLCPPEGSSHLELEGDANACIGSVISMAGLDGLYRAAPGESGIQVSYRFARFVDAWRGLAAMLGSAGAKPRVSFDGKRVTVGAEPVASIAGEEWDADTSDVSMSVSWRPVNHLVCAGEGENQERTVVHLFADEDGNVSQTQALFGVDERTELYSYTTADEDQLIEDGTKRLLELQEEDACSVVVDSGDYGIGDSAIANSPATGESIESPIVEITATVRNGVASIDYSAGEPSWRGSVGTVTA